MPFLIDGYNLLYALGQLTPRSGRPALAGARRWLLAQLRLGHGAGVTVVYDGKRAPPGTPGDQGSGDVRVEFSQGESADDLIEGLIAAEPSPRALTVVSDDHRIRQAARRRGCPVLGCLDYAERHLQPGRREPAPASPEQPAKPEQESPEEAERWLREFRDLGDDPLLRDPF
jgi:hypothetical protein